MSASQSCLEVTPIAGDLMFECKDDFRTFTVSRLVDKVSLNGNIGNQLIAFHGDLDRDQLTEAFPDRQAVVRKCMLHTRGVLNKVAAMRRAKELVSEELLAAERLDALLHFLETCNCAPVRAIEKLVRQGYENIVDKLGLYEESPLMEETSQAFFDFIQALPKGKLA